MLWWFVSALARPAVRLWTTTMSRYWSALPRPSGLPQVHSAGSAPDQILLIGNGPAVGHGVLSHDLALPGALARQLSARTGRAADIDVHADGTLTAATIVAALGSTRLERFDAVITTIGLNEVLGLSSCRAWESHLGALIDHVESASPTGPQLLIVGVPPMEAISHFPRPLRVLFNHHARLINAHSRRACSGHERATFVPFVPPAATDTDRYRGRDTYERWAALIVPWLHNRIDPTDRYARTAGHDEEARQRALDALGILDTEPEEEFDAIARTARDLFGVSGAAITFIDHDRQWIKAATGMPNEMTPRATAFCKVTITGTETFVVEDATGDARFRDHPLVRGETHLRFYAGQAIESSNGHRVGALCIVDTEPRSFSRSDSALLRSLAIRVQRQLWARSDRDLAG
ncbi:GAF domain-containing protein [Lacisediminihabitans profunda]|uniref:GAF domain-containing protein n=1 Tax=Lacisediminihabitans profunda TaxID=2594790 RepID=A0A5C8UWJ8_9MICO|nr:GAF domain-containing protein [Lacisediminihabitans profunda]TXN31977.1 GAF domain-containing protein [Lacisediminihabitans profunda]